MKSQIKAKSYFVRHSLSILFLLSLLIWCHQSQYLSASLNFHLTHTQPPPLKREIILLELALYSF